MNRIYFFVSASNGYDRGYIDSDSGDVIDHIHQSLDVKGYKDYLVTICKNTDELNEMEEEYLSLLI